VKAITANKPGGATRIDVKLPAKATRSVASDHDIIRASLGNLLLFNKLDKATATRIVAEMYELTVEAGEILIQQGDSGSAATKLFVVKSGKFEVRLCVGVLIWCVVTQRHVQVLERRKDVMFKVNSKERGDVFGEISLMYDCPRSATVASTVR
jgi:cGMP-dependent protein kinase 2